MRIALVTWTTFYNYGTQLQAYALQQFLNKNGYENEILNDKTIIEEHWEKWKASYQKYYGNNTNQHSTEYAKSKNKVLRRMKKYYYKLRKNNSSKLRPFIESRKRIELFKNDYLKMYNNIEVDFLEKLDSRYSVYICGSDQIWSPLDWNFNSYYFLSFTKKKKISYAASIGTEIISPEKKEKIKKWLRDFNSISVREKQNINQLIELTQRKVSFVCDPTLLLDQLHWKQFCAGKIIKRGQYVLCYFLENEEWYFDYAKAISKYYKMPAILIPSRIEHVNRRICLKSSVGPKEFVRLFYNASFVLTDSYHGCIFSIQFSKQFLCIKRFKDNAFDNQNIRVFSLFDRLELTDRIVDSDKNLSVLSSHIDYKLVQKKLEEFREESKAYLLKALEE